MQASGDAGRERVFVLRLRHTVTLVGGILEGDNHEWTCDSGVPEAGSQSARVHADKRE